MSKKFEILELRKNGNTINEIVAKLNCAKSTVSYHINNANLGGNINNFLFGINDEDIEKIKNLRLNEKTYDEIHQTINISKDKLKKICRNLDLNKQVFIRKITLDKNDVLLYYKKVKSLRKTAEYFCASRERIRKYINDNEIIKKTKTKTKSQSVIDWRKRKKIELVKYLGGKCKHCGYDKCINALQFHHKDSNEKDFTISRKSYSFEKLKKEANKCILLCANCHIELHEKLK